MFDIYPKHIFFNFERFLNSFRESRLLNLNGFMRTGKTLFSVALGWHMKQHGFVAHSIFNFPVSFGDGFPLGRRNIYAVVDEAGRLFDNRFGYKDKDLNKLLVESIWSLGKDGSYIVYPSFLDLDVKLRSNAVRCWRSLKVGKLFWVYRWEMGEEEEAKRTSQNYKTGVFIFFNPLCWAPHYDTYYQPSGDELRLFALRLSGQSHAR